jgi:hypothetical protein
LGGAEPDALDDLTVDLHGSGERLVQQREHARQSGLAGAARAGQTDRLSRLDGQGDVGDHRIPVAGGDAGAGQHG